LAIAAFATWALAFFYTVQLVGKPYPGFLFDTGAHVEVAVDSRPESAGIKAGLRPYDTLLKANGRPITCNADLQRLVATVPLGTPIAYRYERDGKQGSATVRTEVFHLSDFVSLALPQLLIGCLFLLIGAVAFWMRPALAGAQGLCLTSIVIGLDLSLSVDFSNSLATLNDFLDFSLGGVGLFFSQVFPEQRAIFRRQPYWLLLLLVPPILVATKLVPYNYELFSTWAGIGILGFLGNLVVARVRTREPVIKKQATIVLTGTAVAFLPYFGLVLVPFIVGKPSSIDTIPYLASIFAMTLFPCSIAYAIIRHQMFDIEVVIKRTVVYGSVVGALTAVYVLILSLFRLILDAGLGASGSPIGNVLAAAIVAVMFAPLRDRTKLVVDRLFFRGRYQFDAVVTEFGEKAREILDSRQLLYAFLHQIDQALHPAYIAVLARPASANELVLTDSLGLDGRMIVLPVDHPAIEAVYLARKPISDEPTVLEGLPENWLLPLSVKGELNGCVLVGPRKSEQAYTEQDRRLLVSLSQQLAVWLKVAQLFDDFTRRTTELKDLVRMYEEAMVQAMTDPLTGLHNRRAFMEFATRTVAEARRYDRLLSLILFDIDHFKQVNDQYGHTTGDQVIAVVAKGLSNSVRSADAPARWGGEEFVVALPETDLPSAMRAAERIRQSVEHQIISDGDGKSLPTITVSRGVATLRPEDTLETLIERADRALYVSKAKGRNQAQTLDDLGAVKGILLPPA